MLNLIGTEQPPFDVLTGNYKLYRYNKAVKAQRTLGHINFIGDNQQSISEKIAQFESL